MRGRFYGGTSSPHIQKTKVGVKDWAELDLDPDTTAIICRGDHLNGVDESLKLYKTNI